MDLLQPRQELWIACRNFGMLNEVEARKTFRAICKSVKMVHDVNIVHRDLKVRLVSFFFKCLFYSLRICFSVMKREGE
jgi:serine/threonine protein kinase